MINKKIFKKTIGTSFGLAGFVKQGQSWYLDGKDTLVVVNLEKADIFSTEQYVINIGFWLKALGDAIFPSYNHCHLYYRVERLFPLQRELILTGCSLVQSNDQLLEELSGFIKNQLIPFLFECTNERKLREFMLQGALTGGFVRHEAKIYLINN